ncbi:MAG: hypothetical protein IPK60_08000 [Sandaracinaceae bacterium]|nr:hypothetical protein [Sandaracinaceae bacterium]
MSRAALALALSLATAGIALAQDVSAVIPVVGTQIAIEDPSSHALDHFYNALRGSSPASPPVRVLILGDSHTAGDSFPGEIRRALQMQFGNGGVGFFFPVRPWRYYQVPFSGATQSSGWTAQRITMQDRVPLPLGLAGMAVSSIDSAEVATLNFSDPAATTHLEVWSYAEPGGGSFDITATTSASECGECAPTTIHVSAAAAIPHLVVTNVNAARISQLTLRTSAAGTVRIFGVVAERGAGGVVVDALGINGARVGAQLLWQESVFQESLQRRAPSLVVFQYGTNEAGDDQTIERYEVSMRTAIARVRRAVPNASCVLVGPTDRPQRVARNTYEDRPRTALIIEAQRRIARALGCGFFDTVAFQGGPLSTATWATMTPPLAHSDRVHLTRLGYIRWAEVFTTALLERFQR